MSDTLNGQANGHAIDEGDLADLLEKERRQARLLRAELEQERSHRTRAESAASSAATQRLDSEEAAVEARLTAAEDEARRLRRDYTDALAEGRFDDAADANDKILTLRAAQMQDRQYKTWLGGEKQRTQQAPPRPQQDPGPDLSSYTAGQKRWIQDNPAFLTDEKVRLRTIAGHNLAVAEGVTVDSEPYFEIINETVHGPNGRAPNGRAEPESEDGHEGTPYRAPPEMPVTRRAVSQSTRAVSYRLTPLEKEAADTTMPDIPTEGYVEASGKKILGRYERYALNRQRLREQGRA